jgi:predicted metal-dependent peptidase
LTGQDAKNVLTTPTRQVYADPTLAASQSVDKIAAARVWLLKEKPFFGVLARAFQIEPSLKVPAFRLLPDDRLLVNPLVVLEIRFPSLCARLAHLAMHAALGALARRGPREPLRWNIAHDLAIDPLLRAASMPAGAPLPLGDLPAGASAEEYYLLLPEGTRPDDLWCDVSDPPPPEAPPVIQGTFTRQDDGEGDDPGESGGDGDGEGQGDRSGQSEGEQDPQEQDQGDDEADQGDDDQGQDDTPPLIEARSRELQWKMRLNAALEEELASGGKTFGEVPAWIDELVRATIEPPPNWTAELQRSVSMLTRTDRSFLRPSRRMSALAGADGSWPDVVAMPGRRIMPAGQLVVVIDTSASIDSATLARFLGSLASIATAEGFDEVRLVQADAEVTKDEVILAAELLFQDVAIIGRGGTDFGPAIRKLALDSRRLGERFTVVYLTDLDGKFPAASEAVPLEVVWVVPGKPVRAPPFGKLAEMGWQR